MKNHIELLAPGGDIDSIKAAIIAGADAIYCGLDRFNARTRATNLNFEELKGIIKIAHNNNCKVFLTLNIIIVESEIKALVNLLNELINTRIDGVIVQDLGMLYLLSTYFQDLEIHASTQLTTHNKGQIKFLKKLAVSRVNLSRELNINEIKSLTLIGHENNILTEVFVHGSYCIGFSGICYLSSVLGGKSGNRGRCSQPCRDRYVTTREGKNYPLNLKDNSAFFDLKEISDARVDSIKIEGRIKKSDYVYTVVNCWKKQIQHFYDHNCLDNDNSDLYKVFNREFSNSFLQGTIDKDMYIDNPRVSSIQHQTNINYRSGNRKKVVNKTNLYEEKAEIKTIVKNKIKELIISKDPLDIIVSGEVDLPLKVFVKTIDSSFTVFSETYLTKASTTNSNQKDEGQTISPVDNIITKNDKKINPYKLKSHLLLEKFKPLNNSNYYIQKLDIDHLQSDLFLPFKELTAITKKILHFLNDSKEKVSPIDIPFLPKHYPVTTKPVLSVLISSQKDLDICTKSSTKIYFQLPNNLLEEYSKLTELFLKNKQLIPWFPSILLGENYDGAIKFLKQVKPKLIVTNNTGIAYEAYSKKIPWIAGPYLNIVNSFSLLCLKENFECHGSFISNEISKIQIKRITPPKNFKLFYSIYHPILLLSSRQCLFHQIIGCKKKIIDEQCIQDCQKSSSIKNLKDVTLYIEKTRENYHCIYNDTNFLNTDILTDLPDVFSSFFIDLRRIITDTKVVVDKNRLIHLFENLLNGVANSKEELRQNIHHSTCSQYQKGI